MRPSILAVTSQVPWPLDRGGHIRTFNLLRAIASQFDVRLVAGAQSADASNLDAFASAGITLIPVGLGRRRTAAEAARVITAALRGDPYVCYRRHDRAPIRQRMQRELDEHPPQLVYLDHLDSLLFSGMSSAPEVIDMHNVYSTLVRRTATERGGLEKWYLLRESRLLDRIEERAVRAAAAMFAVSSEDAAHFRRLGAPSVHVVANGVDCAYYSSLPSGGRSGAPLVLYVGTLSWEPNVTAASYLIRTLLPFLRGQSIDARVRIIGRNPPRELLALNSEPGAEVIGDVDDVRPHLREARLLAVPLEAGGGSRLKILEAFAAGLPVVSTPVGCEGLAVQADRDLVIADLPQFPAAVLALLGDKARADHLAHHARATARSAYDWESIGKIACSVIANLLGAQVASFGSGGSARRDATA